MGLISAPSGTFQLDVNGKPALTFNVTTTDRSWQSDDGRVRMNYIVMENNFEDSNGLLVLEVAQRPARPGQTGCLPSDRFSHQ
jgi:hypothetical protein